LPGPSTKNPQPTSGQTGQKYPAPVSAQIATSRTITARNARTSDREERPERAGAGAAGAGKSRLFFGAEPKELAAVQAEAHRRELAEYERIREAMPEEVPRGPRLALEAGIRHTRTWIGFWKDLEAGSEIAG
jgi:Virulence activator alpha C-term